MRIAPPTRTSSSQTGFVNPFGPHHCAVCRTSVQALNTRLRGASKTRVMIRSHSDDPVVLIFAALVFAFCADMLLLLLTFQVLSLQFAQIHVEPVEALFPEAPVVFYPSGHILQRGGLQPAR